MTQSPKSTRKQPRMAESTSTEAVQQAQASIVERVDAGCATDQSSRSAPDSWLCEQIRAKLGPQVGQLLINASHAHGALCDSWLCEQLDKAGHREIIIGYQEHLERLRRQVSRTQLAREEQTDG